MEHAAIPAAVLAEFAAAYYLAREKQATVELELAGDSRGNVRLRTVAIRGASSQALVPVDKGVTIEPM